MKTGQIVLNGITDADLIMILKEKEKDKGLGFSPQALQPHTVGAPPNQVSGYNNCALTWAGPGSLKTVYTILHKLIHGHDKEPGQ